MLTPSFVKIDQLGQELNLVEIWIHKETKWRSHGNKMAISHRDKMAISHRDKMAISHRDKMAISHRDRMAISHRDKMAISDLCFSKWRKLTWVSHRVWNWFKTFRYDYTASYSKILSFIEFKLSKIILGLKLLWQIFGFHYQTVGYLVNRIYNRLAYWITF
jgi:hypothetical protein